LGDRIIFIKIVSDPRWLGLCYPLHCCLGYLILELWGSMKIKKQKKSLRRLSYELEDVVSKLKDVLASNSIREDESMKILLEHQRGQCPRRMI